MQAQTTRRLQELRFNRFIFGGLAVIGLTVAIVFAIQALTDGETATESQQLSPVNVVTEDPPLPKDWVDPYFNQPVVIPVEEDPPLPEGWVDPYFNAPVAIPAQEDPPLPEGWSSPCCAPMD